MTHADETMNGGLVDPRPIKLGSLRIGRIALGCARWDFQTATELANVVEAAAEIDVNLIDAADVYGGDAGPGRAEELLGEIFSARRGLRDRFFLATKAGAVRGLPYDSSPGHLVRSCHESLRRLGCDSVDLFQVHRPDFFTHPHDVAQALTALMESGKTRYVGVSNYTSSQLDALLAYLPGGLVSTSPQISVTHLDALRDGSLDQAAKLDLAVLGWAPLAKGRVALGRDVRPELLDVLDELAERENVTRTAIALAFVLALPGKTVALLGTTDPLRFRAAAMATSLTLDRGDVYRLIQSSEGATLP